MDGMRRILALPDGCPAATAGVALPGGREAVIGLANGDAYRWDARDGSREKVFSGRSPISAIDTADGRLLVGAKEGPLAAVDADGQNSEILQEWSQCESSRIWACAWLGGGARRRAVATSAYGGVRVYERGSGAWDGLPLHGGHAHSVLAVGVYDESLMATGDSSGRIVAWERRGDGAYAALPGALRMDAAVEALAWASGRVLLGMDAGGIVRQFERDPGAGAWRIACEIDAAAGRGACMHVAGGGRTLLAATQAEVVQVDLGTMRSKTLPLGGAVGIRSEGGVAYAVAADGMYEIPIRAIDGPPDAAECRRIEVGLAGRAGSGMSELCGALSRTGGGAFGPPAGQRAWTLEMGGSAGAAPARQALFRVLEGRESAPPALDPDAGGPDVVLAPFRQGDRAAFDAACGTLRGLRPARRGAAARRILVATGADGDSAGAADGDLRRAVGDGVADGFLSIDARTGSGAGKVLELLGDEGLWRGAARVVKSGRNRAVEIALDRLKRFGEKAVLGPGDVRSAAKRLSGADVPEALLSLLLEGMGRRGLLAYYGGTGKVVLDDEDHDRVRSGMPALAARHNGIVEAALVEREFGESAYADPVLAALKEIGACFECRGRLVFPHLLRDGEAEVPEQFRARLEWPRFAEALAFDAEGIDAAALARAAAGLNLPCVDATRTGGLFASEDGAGLHYRVWPSGGPADAPYAQIAYRVGGTRRIFCKMLADEFAVAARRIGGREILDIWAPRAGAR